VQIGIFAKTFVRPNLAATLDAVAAHGIKAVQFNLSCAGLPTLPDALDDATCAAIRRAHAERGLTMVAISGTYNMIHPDPQVRRDGLRRLAVLAAAGATLGTATITLCTGSRDPDNMWRGHPDNGTPAAWRDLLASMAAALAIAERYGVTLGVEPEVSNVIDTAAKARRLLDELRSPHLKIIMDGANLFHHGELLRQHSILDEAFDLLGGDIVLAHAKDLRADGAAGAVAAGSGLLDYRYYLGRLQASGYTGPLILHALREDQVDAAVTFLGDTLHYVHTIGRAQ
jgi:sugar phosphate isomerase/epimerase